MKRIADKREKRNERRLLVSMVLVFLALGTVVYAVSEKISREMSSSAIQNLSESLDLIQGSIEAILRNETEFQALVAQEAALAEAPESYVLAHTGNRTAARMSFIPAGETSGVSSTGTPFSEEGLRFHSGETVMGMPVSQSYQNGAGDWAYTIKCPVCRGGETIGTLYVEYVYDSIGRVFPWGGFYSRQASLYIMDPVSRRFVLWPPGQRNVEYEDLDSFYQANGMQDRAIRAEAESCLESGRHILYYYDVRGMPALHYMWPVNGGTVFLVGYVPVEAIQQEGKAVNQNILIVMASMLAAFFLCILLYYLSWKQQDTAWKEREAERRVHNRQLADALRAAQIASESKTTFLSNMSHDIRTPMNAVLGFTTLLEKDAENPTKVREYTRKIKSSGQHLLNLINDVLDISKIESGKVVLSFEPFTLGDVISAVYTIIQPMAREKKQDFQLEVNGIQRERLLGDETRMSQILLNLLSNAVKYTPEGGHIWLRVKGLKRRSNQYEYIRIEVEDDGYGMTPEYLKTIFDAFTRAENSTTNKVQGTGLGMAITKSIVELMGGSIEVSSEVNRGSLFCVELELRIVDRQEEEPASGGAAVSAPEEDAGLEGMRFLAAEDNEINAEILSELLEMEGARCEIVENGRLAVERFRQSGMGWFDAVLMDVQMPVMNGHEAARAIRALAREDAKRVPIIAMTANAFAEDEKAALDAGMDAHVSKPLDVKLLKRAIQECLEKNPPEGELRGTDRSGGVRGV